RFGFGIFFLFCLSGALCCHAFLLFQRFLASFGFSDFGVLFCFGLCFSSFLVRLFFGLCIGFGSGFGRCGVGHSFRFGLFLGLCCGLGLGFRVGRGLCFRFGVGFDLGGRFGLRFFLGFLLCCVFLRLGFSFSIGLGLRFVGQPLLLGKLLR